MNRQTSSIAILTVLALTSTRADADAATCSLAKQVEKTTCSVAQNTFCANARLNTSIYCTDAEKQDSAKSATTERPTTRQTPSTRGEYVHGDYVTDANADEFCAKAIQRCNANVDECTAQKYLAEKYKISCPPVGATGTYGTQYKYSGKLANVYEAERRARSGYSASTNSDASSYSGGTGSNYSSNTGSGSQPSSGASSSGRSQGEPVDERGEKCISVEVDSHIEGANGRVFGGKIRNSCNVKIDVENKWVGYAHATWGLTTVRPGGESSLRQCYESWGCDGHIQYRATVSRY